VVWQKSVGQGFSAPVVAQQKLILFHRLDDKETVECLDAKSGKQLWLFDYPTAYRDDFGFDEGPRATPCIAAGNVYTYGAEGMLHCIDFGTGKKIWSVNAKTEFQAPKGFFGIACSPLVESNSVLAHRSRLSTRPQPPLRRVEDREYPLAGRFCWRGNRNACPRSTAYPDRKGRVDPRRRHSRRFQTKCPRPNPPVSSARLSCHC